MLTVSFKILQTAHQSDKILKQELLALTQAYEAGPPLQIAAIHSKVEEPAVKQEVIELSEDEDIESIVKVEQEKIEPAKIVKTEPQLNCEIESTDREMIVVETPPEMFMEPEPTAHLVPPDPNLLVSVSMSSPGKIDDHDLPYQCIVCQRRFLLQKILLKHIECVHRKNRPHTCQICYKSFTQDSHLKNHMAIHSGENFIKFE